MATLKIIVPLNTPVDFAGIPAGSPVSTEQLGPFFLVWNPDANAIEGGGCPKPPDSPEYTYPLYAMVTYDPTLLRQARAKESPVGFGDGGGSPVDQDPILKAAPPKGNAVSHPAHYNQGKIEVIEFIEDKKLGFHRGNAVKYIARAGLKNPEKEIEDLEKAKWYLEREIALVKERKTGEAAPRPNDMRKA